MIAVFDLDGTLCDNSQREHLAHAAAGASGLHAQKIWDEFHEGIERDAAIKPVLEIMHSLARCGNVVEVWTARPEKYREATQRWLNKHFLQIPDRLLLMRPEEDWRPAPILKLEWYLFAKHRKPSIVFEDHPETTRLLRYAGCVVAQVADRKKETL